MLDRYDGENKSGTKHAHTRERPTQNVGGKATGGPDASTTEDLPSQVPEAVGKRA